MGFSRIARSPSDASTVLVEGPWEHRYVAANGARFHVATLGEGMAADLAGTGITVSTIFPGFIRSEINEKVKKAPFMVDTETGCRALAAAIERESRKASVPSWPWAPLGFAMRVLPLSVVAKMS